MLHICSINKLLTLSACRQDNKKNQMKTKTLVIITAAVLAVGAIVGIHAGNCPMKNVKPCEMLKK